MWRKSAWLPLGRSFPLVKWYAWKGKDAQVSCALLSWLGVSSNKKAHGMHIRAALGLCFSWVLLCMPVHPCIRRIDWRAGGRHIKALGKNTHALLCVVANWNWVFFKKIGCQCFVTYDQELSTGCFALVACLWSWVTCQGREGKGRKARKGR